VAAVAALLLALCSEEHPGRLLLHLLLSFGRQLSCWGSLLMLRILQVYQQQVCRQMQVVQVLMVQGVKCLGC
jgi:hypothetical protein